MKVDTEDLVDMSTICDRTFDLTNEDDAEEWAYGHDCEPEPEGT